MLDNVGGGKDHILRKCMKRMASKVNDDLMTYFTAWVHISKYHMSAPAPAQPPLQKGMPREALIMICITRFMNVNENKMREAFACLRRGQISLPTAPLSLGGMPQRISDLSPKKSSLSRKALIKKCIKYMQKRELLNAQIVKKLWRKWKLKWTMSMSDPLGIGDEKKKTQTYACKSGKRLSKDTFEKVAKVWEGYAAYRSGNSLMQLEKRWKAWKSDVSEANLEQYEDLVRMAMADGTIDDRESKKLADARRKYNVTVSQHEELLVKLASPRKFSLSGLGKAPKTSPSKSPKKKEREKDPQRKQLDILRGQLIEAGGKAGDGWAFASGEEGAPSKRERRLRLSLDAVFRSHDLQKLRLCWKRWGQYKPPRKQEPRKQESAYLDLLAMAMTDGVADEREDQRLAHARRKYNITTTQHHEMVALLNKGVGHYTELLQMAFADGRLAPGEKQKLEVARRKHGISTRQHDQLVAQLTQKANQRSRPTPTLMPAPAQSSQENRYSPKKTSPKHRTRQASPTLLAREQEQASQAPTPTFTSALTTPRCNSTPRNDRRGDGQERPPHEHALEVKRLKMQSADAKSKRTVTTKTMLTGKNGEPIMATTFTTIIQTRTPDGRKKNTIVSTTQQGSNPPTVTCTEYIKQDGEASSVAESTSSIASSQMSMRMVGMTTEQARRAHLADMENQARRAQQLAETLSPRSSASPRPASDASSPYGQQRAPYSARAEKFTPKHRSQPSPQGYRSDPRDQRRGGGVRVDPRDQRQQQEQQRQQQQLRMEIERQRQQERKLQEDRQRREQQHGNQYGSSPRRSASPPPPAYAPPPHVRQQQQQERQQEQIQMELERQRHHELRLREGQQQGSFARTPNTGVQRGKKGAPPAPHSAPQNQRAYSAPDEHWGGGSPRSPADMCDPQVANEYRDGHRRQQSQGTPQMRKNSVFERWGVGDEGPASRSRRPPYPAVAVARGSTRLKDGRMAQAV
jgi:hypothetical protein